jgi:hypothetical protein
MESRQQGMLQRHSKSLRSVHHVADPPRLRVKDCQCGVGEWMVSLIKWIVCNPHHSSGCIARIGAPFPMHHSLIRDASLHDTCEKSLRHRGHTGDHQGWRLRTVPSRGATGCLANKGVRAKAACGFAYALSPIENAGRQKKIKNVGQFEKSFGRASDHSARAATAGCQRN